MKKSKTNSEMSEVSFGLSKKDEDRNLPLLLVVGAVMFLTTFDITAIIMIMPLVKQDFSLEIGGFAWLMDSYSLAFTVFLMAAGILADRYGRRLGLLAGVSMFLVSSVLCGAVGSETGLLIGRVGQGIGAAFMVCAGLAVLGHRFADPKERAKAFAMTGTMSGAAMALGPAGGGLIAEAFGWHWVFFINVPICVAIIYGAMRFVPESSDPAQRRVDVKGLISFSLTLVAIIWLLLHGPQIGSLKLPIWVALSGTLLLGLTFLLSQHYGKTPLLQLRLFLSLVFVGVCIVPLALSVGYWGVLVYLPLFLQERLAIPPDSASYFMLAATIPMVVLPLFSGKVAGVMSVEKFFAGGLIVVAVGIFVLAAGAYFLNMPITLFGMFVAGIGTAILNPQMMAKIIGAAPKDQAGAASAIAILLRQGGFALGIALLGGIFRVTEASGSNSSLSGDVYTNIFLAAGAITVLSAVAVYILIVSPRRNA